MRSKANSVDIITMGCSKNLVDSERLLGMFERAGYLVRHNPSEICAKNIVVNTCGFIGDAKEESIDMILECCEYKKRHKGVKLFVMGCLSQRYAQELPRELGEVDGWYGKFDWAGILDHLQGGSDACAVASSARKITTGHHAYLKIAEGCNRFCAFCAIPLITGRYKSRPIEEIVDEVKSMVAQGVSEFNVIAQDLSYYGTDIYGKQSIAQLVEAIAQVPGVVWIRLHYAYPADFPYDLLPVMAKYDNVCKYLDIALQHCGDNVLANMRRHITGEETRQLLDRIRREVPGIHLRTTLMVGFPGEGEAEYRELLDFVKEQRFERMGAFAYCEEEDTYAAKHYSDEVSDDEKQERLDQLMKIQEEIALDQNEEKIGLTMTVVVDSEDEDYYVCRSQYDSPEVDPVVLVDKQAAMKIGEYYRVKITDCLPFELIAEAVDVKHGIAQALIFGEK